MEKKISKRKIRLSIRPSLLKFRALKRLPGPKIEALMKGGNLKIRFR
jgi:hypothetical protein